MKPYRLRLTLLGPIVTPLTGDTLFGHLCWGMAYSEGRAALEAFLAETASDTPPLVIGDACPAGFVPAPLLPVADSKEFERMLAALKVGADVLAAHDRLKLARKRRWIPTAALERCKDQLTAESVLHACLDSSHGAAPAPLHSHQVAHNTINRLTQHTAEEVGLFFQTEVRPDRSADFDVHILSSLPAERVTEIFRNGLAGGFGRDASTGKGHLRVGELDASPWPQAEAPNAALTLGCFAPSNDDPAHGWWRSETRLGKVSGAWADDEGGEHPPFKYPLTVLTAGSLLGPWRKPWLGRVVDGVHPTRNEVVTVAMAPALSVHCPALRDRAGEEAA